jgi:hypothetical protein
MAAKLRLWGSAPKQALSHKKLASGKGVFWAAMAKKSALWYSKSAQTEQTEIHSSTLGQHTYRTANWIS